jgi:hypothetical protein
MNRLLGVSSPRWKSLFCSHCGQQLSRRDMGNNTEVLLPVRCTECRSLWEELPGWF